MSFWELVRKSYRFRATWSWVNSEIIFILKMNYSFTGLQVLLLMNFNVILRFFWCMLCLCIHEFPKGHLWQLSHLLHLSLPHIELIQPLVSCVFLWKISKAIYDSSQVFKEKNSRDQKCTQDISLFTYF